jgi:hypothetical protein
MSIERQNQSTVAVAHSGQAALIRATFLVALLATAGDVSFTEVSLIIVLADGRQVSAPLEWFPRLRRATAKQRKNWRLIGGGIGIHWEDVDEDISVRSLLAQ